MLGSNGLARLAWALLGTVACGLAAPASAADQPKLGYSAGFLTDPFQAVLVQETLKEAAAQGMTALPATNANGDAAKQISDIHNLIATGAQVLVLNPTDSQAIVPALAFAEQKKVPAVSIDIAPAGGAYYIAVRADNTRMGEDACKAVGEGLKGKGTVLSLMGDQATTNGRDRTIGFDNCMRASYPGIKIIAQPTNWKADRATSIAQTIVTSTPDLSAIYMQSDSVMLAGVLNVLKSAGKLKKVGEPGHIFAVSIDGTAVALDRLREGMIDTVISQPLNLYVKFAVGYAKAALDGKTVTAGPTDHNSSIVPVGKSFQDLLSATVVTKSNADDATLWGNKAKS